MFPVSSLAFFVRSWLEDLSEESRDLLTGGGEVMAAVSVLAQNRLSEAQIGRHTGAVVRSVGSAPPSGVETFEF